MGKVLQIVCVVTILVTVTVNMTNAQGKIISMCMHTRVSFSDDALLNFVYMATCVHDPILSYCSFSCLMTNSPYIIIQIIDYALSLIKSLL